MSQPHTTCSYCQGTQFALYDGHFYCMECNTQSQNDREQVFEKWVGGTNVQAPSRKVSQKKLIDCPDQREKLTSWEVLNYVLKGIVEELIHLGAKPELKLVCLQLWASYLRQLDVAFTSVDIVRKPRLGYNFKTSDAEIVFGVTKRQLKEKSWRSRKRSGSESEQSSVTSQPTSIRSRNVRLGFSKRALARSEYSKMSQDTAKSFSQTQTLEELDSASASEAAYTPKRIKVTKHTRSLLSSSGASSTEDELNTRRRIARREVQSVCNVTTAKVVAIVNIALCLTDSQIQLSDFLRWVEEGHISLKQARKHLPADASVDYRLQQTMESSHLSYVKCQGLVSGMCKQLGIDTLPPVDLGQLASRYCQELQLPDEFVALTRRLLGLMEESRAQPAGLGEVEVMAAIVVVMKLLFSLDDCTEFHLSHAAQQINRASTQAGDGEEVMFVWRDWQHLLECRKAVLAALHLPTRQAVYETSEIGRDTQLFLLHTQHMNKDLPACGQALNKNALNKNFKETVTQLLQKYIGEQELQDGDERIEFPASLTPLHSNTQYLLSRHRQLVEPVVHILQRDFTKQSIQHVLAPDRCIAVGLANDLNIVEKEGVVANFQVVNLARKEKDSAVIPRYRINQVKTKVKIVESLKRNKEKQSKKCSDQSRDQIQNEFQQSLNDLISEDSSEEESESGSEFNNESLNRNRLATSSESVELYRTSSKYWFCHFSTGKNSLSLDEFNMLSIKEFPSSFLWFLKECARTIQVHPKALYVQVIQLEKLHKNSLREAENSTRTKKRRFSEI